MGCLLEEGSAGDITEALVALMDDASGDNAMWKARAISLAACVISALVFLRDLSGGYGYDALTVDSIREHLQLQRVELLASRRDLPSHVAQSLKSYLRSLPGYRADSPVQSETALDQHGYLQMQFTHILGAIDAPISLTPGMAFHLSTLEGRGGRALGVVLSQWAQRHRNGIVVLDGLDDTSPLYTWFVERQGRLEAHQHIVVVGLEGLSRLPEGNSGHRILEALRHWAVMKGPPAAGQDAQRLVELKQA